MAHHRLDTELSHGGRSLRAQPGCAFSHTVNPSRCNRQAPPILQIVPIRSGTNEPEPHLQRTREWCVPGVSRRLVSGLSSRGPFTQPAQVFTFGPPRWPPQGSSHMHLQHPVAIAAPPLSPAGSLPAKSGSAPTGHYGLRSAPPLPRQLLPCVRAGRVSTLPSTRRPARSPRSLACPAYCAVHLLDIARSLSAHVPCADHLAARPSRARESYSTAVWAHLTEQRNRVQSRRGQQASTEPGGSYTECPNRQARQTRLSDAATG